MPTTHTTTISQERLVLLYVLVRGLPIDVGSIIAKEIRNPKSESVQSRLTELLPYYFLHL